MLTGLFLGLFYCSLTDVKVLFLVVLVDAVVVPLPHPDSTFPSKVVLPLQIPVVEITVDSSNSAWKGIRPQPDKQWPFMVQNHCSGLALSGGHTFVQCAMCKCTMCSMRSVHCAKCRVQNMQGAGLYNGGSWSWMRQAQVASDA